MIALPERRRILVSKHLIDLVLRHGARCCLSSDIPNDVRIVNIEYRDDDVLELDIVSASFGKLGPGESDVIVPTFRQIECGRARLESIDRVARDARDLLHASAKSWEEAGNEGVPPMNGSEAIQRFEDILGLTAGALFPEKPLAVSSTTVGMPLGEALDYAIEVLGSDQMLSEAINAKNDVIANGNAIAALRQFRDQRVRGNGLLLWPEPRG